VEVTAAVDPGEVVEVTALPGEVAEEEATPEEVVPVARQYRKTI
jgi:hypothetical protein